MVTKHPVRYDSLPVRDDSIIDAEFTDVSFVPYIDYIGFKIPMDGTRVEVDWLDWRRAAASARPVDMRISSHIKALNEAGVQAVFSIDGPHVFRYVGPSAIN